MIVFTIFSILTTLIPMAFWIFIIVMIVKSVKRTQGNNTNNYDNVRRQRINQKLDGTGNPNRYSTINSHYTQQTLNGKGVGSYVPSNGGHTHAYEHKVEPIGEATVHGLFENRKEAYMERKQQIKADLPKSSYSKIDEFNNGYTNSSYTQAPYNNYGKNGDMASVTSQYDEKIMCKYCGAENIVPKSRTKEYKCYFCREQI